MLGLQKFPDSFDSWQSVRNANQIIADATDDHGRNSPQQYRHIASPRLPTYFNASDCHLFLNWISLTCGSGSPRFDMLRCRIFSCLWSGVY